MKDWRVLLHTMVLESKEQGPIADAVIAHEQFHKWLMDRPIRDRINLFNMPSDEQIAKFLRELDLIPKPLVFTWKGIGIGDDKGIVEVSGGAKKRVRKVRVTKNESDGSHVLAYRRKGRNDPKHMKQCLIIIPPVDGAKVHIHGGGPTEEGSHFWHMEYAYDADQKTYVLERTSSGSDCDGPYSSYAKYVWINGQWCEESSHQRDVYAERMNY